MTLSNWNVSSRSERSLEMSNSSTVSLCGKRSIEISKLWNVSSCGEKLLEMLWMQSLLTLSGGGDNMNCSHWRDHRSSQASSDKIFINALIIHDNMRRKVSRIMFSIGQLLEPWPHLSLSISLSRSKADEAPD